MPNTIQGISSITGIQSITFGGYDADAQAFFNALEADASPVTLNTSQKDSINTLVEALKSASIWTKIKAIYPMIGGVASSHKYNLKDPRDLDAAFRLTFSGHMDTIAVQVQIRMEVQHTQILF